MTFLIFLASVGVLEYLLRDVRRNSGGIAAPPDTHRVADYDQLVSEATSAGDLMSLGKALEAQALANKTEIAPHSESTTEALTKR